MKEEAFRPRGPRPGEKREREGGEDKGSHRDIIHNCLIYTVHVHFLLKLKLFLLLIIAIINV